MLSCRKELMCFSVELTRFSVNLKWNLKCKFWWKAEQGILGENPQTNKCNKLNKLHVR